MYKNIKDMKRLVLDIERNMHELVKKRAEFMGISIRKYVLRAVLEQIKKDLKAQ